MGDDSAPQTYAISNGYRLILRVSLGVFLLFGFGFLGLLWLAEGPGLPDGVGPYLVVAVGSGLFFVLAAAARRTLKRIPFCAVTVDEEGLWPAHREREEALIPWDAITDVRQHAARHFLELLDERGDRLLRLEYQLEEYADLRRRVLEHLRQSVSVDPPERFARKPAYHVFQYALVAALVVGGGYLARHNPYLALIPLGLAALLAAAYVRGLCALTLDTDGLTLHYPFTSHTVPYDTVDDVALLDRRGRGTVESVVRVTFTDGRRPLTLAGLGVDNTILYEKIRKMVT
jgi:hypothetical protein